MPDYLRQVSNPARMLAVICLMLSTLFFGAAFLGLLAMTIQRIPAGAEKVRESIGQLLVGAVFATVSLWMLVRVLRRTRAPNGVTIMPIWFIELFGVLLFGGNVVFAIMERSPGLVLEALSVAGAMIFVRRKVRAKLQQDDEPELSDSPSDDGIGVKLHEDDRPEEGPTR